MFVEVEGARLFFDCAGSKLVPDGPRMREKPTLVVMHGGPGFDHSSLRPYFDRFADTHQVLYFDHRGNGRSSGAPDSWTLAQWGRDVKALCDALGIDRPHVYGNSFGGFVAMSYAAQFPGHPAKLILSSTAARMRLQETYRLLEERGGEPALAAAHRFWEAPDDAAMLDYMRVCMPLYNPRPNPGEALARERAVRRAEVARHFIVGEMRTMDQRAGLARIACPTLVLAGAYDPITPLACSEEIAALVPAGLAELQRFDDAGHGVHRDAPERAEAVIRTFLQGAAA